MTTNGFTSQEGTVDIRAPGGLFSWAGECVSAGPATIPYGAITRSMCRDPEDAYGFVPFNTFRAAPDMGSFDLVAPKWKQAIIDSRLSSCPHDIRKRWSKCLVPNNLESWQLIEDYRLAYVEQEADSEGTIPVDGTAANVMETRSIKFVCRDTLWRITPSRIGESVTTLAINAVRWCSPRSCGTCGAVSDGCQVFRAVTDSGANYLDTPKLITATRAGTGWAFTYTVQDIDPFFAGNEHALDLVCLSNGRVVTVSNAYGGLAYSDDNGANWIAILLTVGGEPNAIWALDWTNVFIVGDGGYIYKSMDGAVTWATVDAGATLTDDLYDVHGYGNVVAVVGANNAFGVSRDNGDTWDAVTGPEPGGDLNVVHCLSESEILVGSDSGVIYRSTDTGDTWVEVVDFAAVLGTTASVAAWDFCGCQGDKGFVLVNDGAGLGWVFRTIDHAMTFQHLYDNSGVKQLLPANSGVNGIACCDPNVAVAVGEVHAATGGYMALIK